VAPRHAGMLGFLAALWGASYLLIKYALEDFSPAFVVFGRTLLAACALLLAVRLQGPGARRALRATLRRPGMALLLGALAIALPFLLITFGELEVPSGLTAVLLSPAPLFVALFAPLLDRSELLGRVQALGAIVALAGVALLVGVESVATLGELLGALAVVAAAASYALSSFVVKNQYTGVPPTVTSAVAVGAAALLSAPFAAVSPPHHAPGLRALLAVGGLGLGGTALAFIVFYRLIAELGAGRASLVTYLAPAFALAYGSVLLDETITPATIVGIVLILGGVALAAKPRKSQLTVDS